MKNLILKDGKHLRGTIEIDGDDIFSVESTMIPVLRSDGEFAGIAYYLDSCCDWIVGKDTDGKNILVPLKKV